MGQFFQVKKVCKHCIQTIWSGNWGRGCTRVRYMCDDIIMQGTEAKLCISHNKVMQELVCCLSLG